MRYVIPVSVLLLVATGCGLFGNKDNVSTTANTTTASNSATSKPARIVDMPSLVGKSAEDVKRVVGIPPKSEMPSFIDWELADGHTLEVNYNKGKQTRISFTFAPTGIRFGSGTISAVPAAADLGDMVGIDVHGKDPSSGTPDSPFITYQNVVAGNQTLKSVTFHRVDAGFTEVSIDLDR